MPSAAAHRLGDLYVRAGDRWFADSAVGLRHLPLTVSLAVVLVTLFLSYVPSSVPPLLVASGAIGAAVQLVASLGRWDRWPRGWRYLLPLGQMVAVGLLEVGSGLPLAGFDVLLFLPVVNLALQPGILGLALALVASALVLFSPVVVGFVEVGRVSPWMHALVDLLVAGLVAVGAHMIVGLARRQAAQLERARDETAVTAQRLRDSRDTLRGILRAATEQGFVATDFAGRIVSVNPGAERIFGRPERELLGADVAGLVAADALAERLAAAGPQRWDHAGNRTVLGRAVAGETQVDDWETVLPDGTRRRVELTVTERPALGGREPELPEGYLVVVTDVTARYEEERTQDEFIGLVSHELRTPLASILGYVDLMRLEGDRLDEEQRGYLAVVDRNARRLRSLVDDLLTSAQMASGRYALAADEIDVVQVVREAVGNERPAAEAAGVDVEVVGDARVPLRSDAGRLGQVVDNLLSNAVKYSERGGRVRVTVTAGAGPQGTRLARLQVADQGSGIPADELEHITERFYRSRDTRRRRVRGVGLGLSLVDQIVHDHGGTMTFRSEPGQGTEVDVTLPDVTPPAER